MKKQIVILGFLSALLLSSCLVFGARKAEKIYGPGTATPVEKRMGGMETATPQAPLGSDPSTWGPQEKATGEKIYGPGTTPPPAPLGSDPSTWAPEQKPTGEKIYGPGTATPVGRGIGGIRTNVVTPEYLEIIKVKNDTNKEIMAMVQPGLADGYTKVPAGTEISLKLGEAPGPRKVLWKSGNVSYETKNYDRPTRIVIKEGKFYDMESLDKLIETSGGAVQIARLDYPNQEAKETRQDKVVGGLSGLPPKYLSGIDIEVKLDAKVRVDGGDTNSCVPVSVRNPIVFMKSVGEGPKGAYWQVVDNSKAGFVEYETKKYEKPVKFVIKKDGKYDVTYMGKIVDKGGWKELEAVTETDQKAATIS